ncbi:MAG: AtpZ/AtpI family protein [Bacteroidetes bacterium]|jgi:hypothetical protein|nr:AtpZ/AtpI family protein [Bacteroidota bacterium]MBT3747533.1 AtpZ/AtpI family protein [Bacteroidota bacterium]MBT4398180.1 AtpZ/AtpI family protein [Bacteroidota bacterium]MBT4409461.1 AtpZ/AtpI family protein [Bacteroidota bacterium]MBT5428165.1 AtpZ/AtpI family protein [Bacteroidota bacterium]
MEKFNKTSENKRDKEKKELKDYARYSNLAFKLIVIVLAGFFGGMKLDQLLNLEIPVFTLVLASSGLFLSLYLLIKDLNK